MLEVAVADPMRVEIFNSEAVLSEKSEATFLGEELLSHKVIK
jgi:hypothetical protein